MKTLENNIGRLSNRLQENFQIFKGRLVTPAPHVRMQLLVPVAVLVVAGVFMVSSRTARQSLLLKMAVLASSRFLKKEVAQEDATVI
ncbi:MAG: hypothetical protein V4603_10915 [Pseudomonadota bacterium]